MSRETHRSVGDRCTARKVYLTPTSGCKGHHMGEDRGHVHLHLTSAKRYQSEDGGSLDELR